MHRKNLAGFVVSLTLLAGITVYFAPSALPSILSVSASSHTISLVANYPNWNNSNPQISVTQGDTVTISLSRTDAYTHQFLIDFDNDGAGDTGDCGTTDQCSGLFTTAPPPVGPFTVNSSPATYTYYCTVHSLYMKGNFVVQSATATPDFGINSNPTSLTISQGSSGTTVVTLNSLNGFAGTVTLSSTVSPSGPQASLNPASISLTTGGSASSTLTLSTSSSGYYSTPVAQGSYTVNVAASSGSQSHSTTVILTVGSTSSPTGNSSLPVVPIIGGIIGAIVVVGVAVFLLRRKP
jgi:plastocyanin